ncbi:hypothetical protein EDD63_10533 [Breznakia blatticola]|uniref:Uncharacterized protein n=1 Tax=Breznakia blatticola TaxID=1754012 RepID=A0A4R8A6A6_9FIRM|nr:hypothetical protein [Breznakia blatticola]TDW25301.1 hypothetical protein EDD63_10533 [Breznakia blatticola]
MKREIIIPKEKMQETKIACTKVLYEVQAKNENNPYKIAFEFLHYELHNYVRLTFIGLFLLCISSCLEIFRNMLIPIIVLYLLMIILIGLFEAYRNSYYQMDELLATTMISPMHAILYKVSVILIIECAVFAFLGILTSILNIDYYFQIVAILLFPLVITSLLCLIYMKVFKQPILCILASLVSYASLSIACYWVLYFSWLLEQQLILYSVFALVLYIIVFIKIMRNSKGGSYGVYY